MKIEDYLSKAVNSIVMSSTSGGSVGSLWLIEFENGISIYVYCAWRIEHKDIVLSTSTDNSTPNTGRLSRSVRELEGNKLIKFELSKQYDLNLFFENDYSLSLFCNVSYSQTEDGGTYDTNWEICAPEEDKVISVSNYFDLKTGKYYSYNE